MGVAMKQHWCQKLLLLFFLLQDCHGSRRLFHSGTITGEETTTTTAAVSTTTTTTTEATTTTTKAATESKGMKTGWAIVLSLVVLGVVVGCAWTVLPGILRIKVGGSTPISQY